MDNQIWYLAQIKPGGLNLAIRNLRDQDVSVFLPLIRSTKRRKGKFVTSSEPLFPGYLFIAPDVENGQWRAISNTRGISRLVSFGEKPSPVPFTLVSELMSRYNQTEQLTDINAFNKGDEVRLTQGPFSDLIATVEQVNSEQRVWLLLDILGRTTRISVDLQSIRDAK